MINSSLSVARLATSLRVLAYAPLWKRACGLRFTSRWRLISEI